MKVIEITKETLKKASENYDDSSFRRGYMHGYNACCDDAEYGATRKQIGNFIDNILRPWRFGKKKYPMNKMIIPPSINSINT
ncbi:hypothetical protein [uncultured Mediterranean phage uvMED]|nr:hypothetical protein [uncultured Mediterranean phage uvMED]